jgi:hypothetical protein
LQKNAKKCVFFSEKLQEIAKKCAFLTTFFYLPAYLIDFSLPAAGEVVLFFECLAFSWVAGCGFGG